MSTRPQVTKAVKKTLEALRWAVLPHATYSPDPVSLLITTCFDRWHVHLQRNTLLL